MVYEKLGRDLPDDWVVLHSLGLPGHETKFWGEADIVVLSTKGFFALEVKGGKVECRDGIWYFGEPGKKGYTKKEDPWTQAKGTMVAIMKKLKEAEPDFGDLLFGFGVVMPMEHFTATGAEIVPEVLLDQRDLHKNMMRYISLIGRFWDANWQEKHGRRYRAPSEKQVRRARDILRPNVESAFSIGGYLTGIEGQLLHLTNAQIKASRRMSANPRTIVRGAAGTGKSILAIERARQLSETGARVLFLTFNQLLARHIAAGLRDDPRAENVDVQHAHGLYRKVIAKAGMLDRLHEMEGEEDFFTKAFPQLFVDAVLETDLPCWDALVIDEAQDLLTPDNLDAFDIILNDGLQRGEWHLFLDPLQNIYGSDVQKAVEDRLADIHPAYDDLWENCRNTKQIASQTSIMSGIDQAIEGAAEGLPCENIYFTSEADFRRKLEVTVEKLLQRDVRPQDIIILSTRKRANSSLASVNSLAGLPVVDVGSGEIPGKNTLHFSTIHSFKGLERGVVLAIDMNDIGEEQWSMVHYTGLSRASGLLRTFLSHSRQAKYSEQAKAFGMRLGGNGLMPRVVSASQDRVV
jgi:hypothetical protein